MKKIYTLAIISSVVLLFTLSLFSRPERVQQIPNGSKNQCLTCHVSPSGGSRNPFGQTIGQSFLSGGKVVWGAELAALDSDGDGYTNGEELLDPNGEWTVGSENPGNANDSGNPGDPTSRPTVSSVFGNFENQAYNAISINNTYPNPFSETTEIQYSLNKSGNMRIEIYSESGIMINEFDLGYQSEGNYNFNWNAETFINTKAVAGLYLVMLQLDEAIIMQKVIVQ